MKPLIPAMVLAVFGLLLFVYGVYLAWKPGGVMIAGLLMFAPAFMYLYGKIRTL